MKLIYLGTSIFAVPALKALNSNENIDLALVITRPDSRSGRGRKVTRSPVAVLADELGVRLLQPEKLREIREVLEESSPDVIISASYGGWLPKWFLGIAPLGVVNIHPSLLPAHRGAAPVIRTILDGDRTTGVCFMLTDEGWDTGDILQTFTYEITGKETAGELEKMLSEEAATALPGVLENYQKGRLKPVPQTGTGSYADKVTPEEAVISWNTSAEEVVRMILAFNPVPGARTVNQSKILKIYNAEIEMSHFCGAPGEILQIDPLVIGCASGSVRLLEVQPQGKRRMSADEFVRGYRLREGVVLGEV